MNVYITISKDTERDPLKPDGQNVMLLQQKAFKLEQQAREWKRFKSFQVDSDTQCYSLKPQTMMLPVKMLHPLYWYYLLIAELTDSVRIALCQKLV